MGQVVPITLEWPKAKVEGVPIAELSGDPFNVSSWVDLISACTEGKVTCTVVNKKTTLLFVGSENQRVQIIQLLYLCCRSLEPHKILRIGSRHSPNLLISFLTI
ncbi:MAG TPA: hypothetical protein VJG64_00635 [Candidatus Paceibacterota bacterium]